MVACRNQSLLLGADSLYSIPYNPEFLGQLRQVEIIHSLDTPIKVMTLIHTGSLKLYEWPQLFLHSWLNPIQGKPRRSLRGSEVRRLLLMWTTTNIRKGRILVDRLGGGFRVSILRCQALHPSLRHQAVLASCILFDLIKWLVIRSSQGVTLILKLNLLIDPALLSLILTREVPVLAQILIRFKFRPLLLLWPPIVLSSSCLAYWLVSRGLQASSVSLFTLPWPCLCFRQVPLEILLDEPEFVRFTSILDIIAIRHGLNSCDVLVVVHMLALVLALRE